MKRGPNCAAKVEINGHNGVFYQHPKLNFASGDEVRARAQPGSCSRLTSGEYQTTWAFLFESNQPGETRLIVRGRVAPGYRLFGLPQWFAIRSGAVAHFVMQQEQLLGIARRAEWYGRH